ncbi:MAG: MAPEG family protein [Ferrovibrio sp.]|uniref:MAPEG family protein n=1 Tax=Ferrovibrio sp. TaxID=1917215 RepID=UPI00391C1A08
MPPFAVTPLYAALCAILLIALSLRVARLRGSLKVALGDGGERALQKAIRVQGNFIEYVPMALLLLFLLELSRQAPLWALHALGAGLLLGRILHAIGLSSSAGLSFGRFVGTILTFSMIMITAIWLLILAVNAM